MCSETSDWPAHSLLSLHITSYITTYRARRAGSKQILNNVTMSLFSWRTSVVPQKLFQPFCTTVTTTCTTMAITDTCRRSTQEQSQSSQSDFQQTAEGKVQWTHLCDVEAHFFLSGRWLPVHLVPTCSALCCYCRACLNPLRARCAWRSRFLSCFAPHFMLTFYHRLVSWLTEATSVHSPSCLVTWIFTSMTPETLTPPAARHSKVPFKITPRGGAVYNGFYQY